MSDRYHHGNLRQALIDAGIRIINESGEDALSLRKAAMACNVSHAAPYAHFKDKEELIGAMQESVTEQFMEELEDAVKEAPDAESELVMMGRRYVSFFLKNPDYFRFLFESRNVHAHLQTDVDFREDYPPFVILKKTYLKYLAENNLNRSREEQEIELLKLWSAAHGLAAIACMPGVVLSFDWEEMLKGDILLK